MTNRDTREDRAGAIVNAFLQNKSMEQKRDYLARGRRFAKLAMHRGQKLFQFFAEDLMIIVAPCIARNPAARRI